MGEDRKALAEPRFGDIIENGWASEDNPTRVGYFVRAGHRTGKMNAGRFWEITDGKGKFWELAPYGDHRITVRQAAELLDGPGVEGWPISSDGPHQITDHRRWLARQLLDSKLSDEEAFGIVAHSPAVALPQPPAAGEEK